MMDKPMTGASCLIALALVGFGGSVSAAPGPDAIPVVGTESCSMYIGASHRREDQL